MKHSYILSSVVFSIVILLSVICALIFGGVIGVVGSIYYFLGIRGYVMDNKEYFDALK